MFARGGILWLAIVQVVSVVACVDVNGGAAELSWTLRDFEGKPISGDDPACTITNIGEVRLNWKAATSDGDDELIADDSEEFPCIDNRGVTGFDIPPGRQMLWIEPICREEMAIIGKYEVPPPIVRTVEEGTVITLDALLIVADPDCTCPSSPTSCPATTP